MDMDGTLLSSDKKIQEKTKQQLMKAQENGIKLVLASGRPHSGIVKYAKELEMEKYDGYIISYNGASAYSCANDTVVRHKQIPKEDAKRILKHLESYDVIPMIQDQKKLYVSDVFNGNIQVKGETFNIIEYEARGGNYLLQEEVLIEFLDFDLNKILVAGESDYLAKHHQDLCKPFIGSYQAMFTAPFYYEFTHNEADKGASLVALIEKLDISLDSVMGFGDDVNDLPFLKIVGHPVAMSNANPKIMDFVDHVCLSHDEEGIGVYLENTFGESYEG